MPRLFTGIEVPKTVADRLAFLQGGLSGARWVEPADYHVTLRFIGDVDVRLAEEIVSLLSGIRRAPFSLRLAGLDLFKGSRSAALVTAVEAAPALLELQGEQERLMQRLGLPAEGRRYRPHVTLARLRAEVRAGTAMDWIAQRSPFASEPFPAGRFVLFSSRASVGGGPYVVEAAFPLEPR